MRGKVHLLLDSMLCVGITPAYAGKSNIVNANTSSYKDHPRLCGEKNKINCARIVIVGSPPPMRGKGDRFPALDPFRGITPAYAGKSECSCR